MKNAKLFITLLLCLVGLSNTSLAQEKLDEFMTQTTPEERAEMQTEYMKESLSLTEQQVPKINEINLKYARKMQDAYASETRKFQRLKKLKRVSEEKDVELKKVLDSNQYETYARNKEAMKEKMRARAKESRSN